VGSLHRLQISTRECAPSFLLYFLDLICVLSAAYSIPYMTKCEALE
jgi:hypothetical protein